MWALRFRTHPSRKTKTMMTKLEPSSPAAAILLAISLWTPAHAGTLRGSVVDTLGAAVANARLQLFDRDSGEARETRSAANGSYAFPNVPDGTYLFEGQASGSLLAGSTEVDVSGDSAIDLTLSVIGPRVEIVVTSSATPLVLQEVAKALDVADVDEIALRNEFSLAEALRLFPGVRVQQLRGPGSFTTLNTRGLRIQDTALLVDGLRFRDAAAPQGDATSFFEDINLVGANRVEFLRGSGSSLYGSHAVGGVINVNSARGGGRPHGELQAEGGGLGMVRGVARVGGGLGRDRFAYSGGVSHLNVTRGYRGGTPHRNTVARGFGKLSLTQNVSLSGRVWGSDAFLGLSESPAFTAGITANFPATGIVPARALPVSQVQLFERGLPFDAGAATFIPSQIDPDNRQVSSFAASAVVLTHQVAPGSSYRLAFHHVDTNRSTQDGPAGPSPWDPAVSNDSRYDGETRTLQARADHAVGNRHLLTAGYEFEDERYLNFNTEESASPVESRVDIDQASHAFFAQDQIRLFDGRMHVTLAGRAQRFALGAPSFSGSESPYERASAASPGAAYTGDVAAAYFFRSTQTKVRAHAGNSFRAPSLFERFGGTFSAWSGGFSYWGDPRLDPERSVAVDAGIDQWLHGSKVRLSGSAFYTDLRSIVIFDFANFPPNDVFGRYGGYRSSTGGVARGVEFSSRFTPAASMSVTGSYTYTNSDSRTPTIGTDFFQVPGQSAHMFSMMATQWIRERLNVTVDLFAASDYILSPFGALGRRMQFAGPVKADVVVRYDVPVADGKTLEFYGKAENVFDRELFEDGFGSPGRWVIGGVRYAF